jgi:hypothetical protein
MPKGGKTYPRHTEPRAKAAAGAGLHKCIPLRDTVAERASSLLLMTERDTTVHATRCLGFNQLWSILRCRSYLLPVGRPDFGVAVSNHLATILDKSTLFLWVGNMRWPLGPGKWLLGSILDIDALSSLRDGAHLAALCCLAAIGWRRWTCQCAPPILRRCRLGRPQLCHRSAVPTTRARHDDSEQHNSSKKNAGGGAKRDGDSLSRHHLNKVGQASFPVIQHP